MSDKYPPKNTVGYPIVEGWLLQCEAYFKELQSLGNRASGRIRDALIDFNDASEDSALNNFIRQWVRLLTLLATRGTQQPVKTRFCRIVKKNVLESLPQLKHDASKDSGPFGRLFIQVNATPENSRKRFLAYVIVGCNSNVLSPQCCNECKTKDCNIALKPVGSDFKISIHGMLHQNYIAIPSFDFPAVLEDDNHAAYVFENAIIDTAYLLCYLETYLGTLSPHDVTHRIIEALRDAVKTNEVEKKCTSLTLSGKSDPDDKSVLLKGSGGNVLPQALHLIVEGP